MHRHRHLPPQKMQGNSRRGSASPRPTPRLPTGNWRMALRPQAGIAVSGRIRFPRSQVRPPTRTNAAAANARSADGRPECAPIHATAPPTAPTWQTRYGPPAKPDTGPSTRPPGCLLRTALSRSCQRKALLRVVTDIVPLQLQMQMRAGCRPGLPHGAQPVPLLHKLSRMHKDVLHVAVPGG